ncbi:MAG: hypothetical protein M1814_006427 [Vezdaea aestivalis]|nr:MAG: hypothetical protein M1814_006427 [Vezdaea aestivalis]
MTEKIAVTPNQASASSFTSEKTPRISNEHDATKSEAVTSSEEPSASSSPVQDDSAVVYPTGLKLGLITLALCLAVFLVALDQTIIATAIPRITDQFNSLEDVGWYGSSYLLTTCGFQLIFGKLYKSIGIKSVYLFSLFLFEIGSAVCGAAPNSIALIIGRAIAGLGCAGLYSGSLIIIAHSVPVRQRPVFTGIIGAMYGLASVAGPLMGGAFTDKVSWRWCFYINLPLGAVTFVVIFFFFSSPHKNTGEKSTWKEIVKSADPYGSIVFLPAIVCLLLALSWGGSKYQWGSARIIALFVLAGVLLIIFIVLQVFQGENATVPTRIIKQRSIAGAAWFAFAIGASFLLMIFYLPIWFQAVKGTTAVKSGINNLPMILGLVILSIIAGGLVTTFGYYTPYMYAASIIGAVGCGLLSTLQVDSGSDKWIGYQALYGMGLGIGLQQALIAAQTVLPIEDVPTGTAVVIFSQTLGGALFVSVGQNVFQNRLAAGFSQIADLDLNLVTAGATTIRDLVPKNLLPQVLQAYNRALTQTFYAATAMAAISIFGSVAMEWVSVKGKKIEAVPA